METAKAGPVYASLLFLQDVAPHPVRCIKAISKSCCCMLKICGQHCCIYAQMGEALARERAMQGLVMAADQESRALFRQQQHQHACLQSKSATQHSTEAAVDRLK